MNDTLVDRIHGGLAGAVIGDAFGAITETLTQRAIKATFGWLTEFQAPDHSPFASGRPKGSFTDDSSQMLMLAETFVRLGRIDTHDVAETLLAWTERSELGRFTGPSTKAALARIRQGEDPAIVGRGDVHNGTGTTNGAAMKVAPAGWLAPGDLAAAVENAVIICRPTHNTQIAISGAAAIAAGCSAALDPGATVDSVVAACIAGAELGERRGIEEGREAPGSSIARRIEATCELARNAGDLAEAVERIGLINGAGLAMVEAAPAAVGLFFAAGGDVRQSAIACANVGDDTDTVGTMAAALAGTLSGRAGVPQDWYELVTTVNDLDLESLAKELAALAEQLSAARQG